MMKSNEEAEGYFNQINLFRIRNRQSQGMIEAFIYISGLNCSGIELN
ncbi:MAG: hypothetical protein IPO45_02125 [Saprospiraceae bacterium]|nr:hypothetical protein [Candidatus Brachybacter algidus]